MIRKSWKTKKTTMEILADRFVTPTATFDHTYPVKGMGVMMPAVDDATAINLWVSMREHRFNYPCLEGKAKPEGPHGYADNGIILEWDMDDADGTTIKDRVQGIVLTEAGDPTYQSSAATAGLGKGVSYDGTADTHASAALADAATVAPYTLVETGDFSVEIVFVITGADATADGDTLFSIRDANDGVGFSLAYDAADHVDFIIEDAGDETTIAGTTDTDDETIHHIIATADRDGNGTLYVDGAAEGGATIASRSGTLLSPSADTKISIGADVEGTGDIPAVIYFVRVYNHCLTATQCLENYRTMLNIGAPGWVPMADFFDGDDLAISASGKQPIYFDLGAYGGYETLKNLAFRASCAVEQTTTPAALDFYWIFE